MRQSRNASSTQISSYGAGGWVLYFLVETLQLSLSAQRLPNREQFSQDSSNPFAWTIISVALWIIRLAPNRHHSISGSFVRLRFNIQIRLERLTYQSGSAKNKRHLVRRTGGLSQAYTSETSPAGSGRQTYYQNAKNRGVASRAKKHLGSGEVLSQASGKLYAASTDYFDSMNSS
ncbi:hypothetical protein PSHT_14401 [Puccinia striiformis]|uniref:Uncharacterized protein n=1 Tax=Puccinia striiformis TaxID=27350 RepID=A0A2S4UKR7_9BASI|nr:hypothetical protein PSHT_14401 [Puccinia striiformis]